MRKRRGAQFLDYGSVKMHTLRVFKFAFTDFVGD